MGIQRVSKTSEGHDVAGEAAQDTIRAKSCMAIIWVQNGAEAFNKISLIESVKKMNGVYDANFTREKPAILMVDYCTKETRAVELVAGINRSGAYAKIVGC